MRRFAFRRVTIAWGWALAILATNFATVQAGVIAGAYASAEGSLGSRVEVYDRWNTYGFASASAVDGAASAFAQSGRDETWAVHLVASTQHSAGIAHAVYVWNDVVRVGAAAPNSLLLHAVMDGTISVGGNGLAEAWAGLAGYQSWYEPNDAIFYQVTATDMAGFLQNLDGDGSLDALFLESGKDPVEVYDLGGGTHSFDHHYSFLLAHDPDLGGYRFALVAQARAHGTAVADFLHTIRITNVTLPDGSPLAGPITFDSGFTLNNSNSVPEPSTLLLCATGGLWFALRRRRGGSPGA
jgi:hypothetical protein